MRRDGLALLDLLMVIAIIIVLASLLLSATRTAARSARIALCASNLRQVGLACLTYAESNRGFLPGTYDAEWHNTYAGQNWPPGYLGWWQAVRQEFDIPLPPVGGHQHVASPGMGLQAVAASPYFKGTILSCPATAAAFPQRYYARADYTTNNRFMPTQSTPPAKGGRRAALSARTFLLADMLLGSWVGAPHNVFTTQNDVNSYTWPNVSVRSENWEYGIPGINELLVPWPWSTTYGIAHGGRANILYGDGRVQGLGYRGYLDLGPFGSPGRREFHGAP